MLDDMRSPMTPDLVFPSMADTSPELLAETSAPCRPESGVAAGPAGLLADFSVEYYDCDCGSPCTPNGCCGHSTGIPMSFTVGGVTFHVDGAQSGDFPDNDENVKRVRAVVKALGELISAG